MNLAAEPSVVCADKLSIIFLTLILPSHLFPLCHFRATSWGPRLSWSAALQVRLLEPRRQERAEPGPKGLLRPSRAWQMI